MKRFSIALMLCVAVAALCIFTPDAFAASTILAHTDPSTVLLATMAGAVSLSRKDDSGSKDPEARLKELSDQFKKTGDQIKEFAEKAAPEIKRLGDLSAESKGKIDELLASKNEVAERIKELEQKLARRGAANDDEAFQTPGEVVIKSDAMKQFVQNRTRGTIAIAIPKASAKAMFSTDVAPVQPGVLQPQLLPGILPRLRQRLFIRDLISPGNTGAPSVAYVRQTGFTNNASIVSEGTQKQASSISYDTQIAHVATIAHVFKAAKQLLDDFPALQSNVDDEMRYGVKYEEEQQILFGDGLGINLNGIVPQATSYSGAFVVAHHQRVDVLRLAILQAELAELPASGIVLHPTDWAHIELTKNSYGEYILANPMNLLGPRLWGLPVVPTKAMTLGDFLTGGFQGGAQVFDREDVNVVIATQNEDDFIRNMITIRCEERISLAVKRPEAFITGTFPEDSE